MLAVPKFTTCDLLQSRSIGLKKGPEGFAKKNVCVNIPLCGRFFNVFPQMGHDSWLPCIQ